MDHHPQEIFHLTTTPPARWALVTGAGKRIGRAICERLHQDGWNLLIHCHQSKDDANALALKLNAARANSATVICLDLSQADAAQSLRLKVTEQLTLFPDTLGALINNASVFLPDGEALDLDKASSIMTINCLQPYLIAKALSPLMTNGGAVVNLCDIHAKRPLKGHGLYSMSKAALDMATLSLAQELAPRIRVNGVSPGAILWPEHLGTNDGGKIDEVLAQIPLGRAGNPQDIAQAVAFLLQAPYVSGQIIAIDGGRSACGFLGAAD
ncbi:SDR family oxidoreductase [Shewanella sp. JM162201]|uniref:SDR family oxidoreductase n=1 Tax=Shewanella jiangmenensis TaxID=2837387 RepID=A0ABS5V6D6_9GAMM|nr:SDR family oxidoreductase [Shewanella jiangmenensis]MBT1445460.1 SDR family oxidoreductase [Shewanella jiangmenensis]